jgi:hypothetical protein
MLALYDCVFSGNTATNGAVSYREITVRLGCEPSSPHIGFVCPSTKYIKIRGCSFTWTKDIHTDWVFAEGNVPIWGGTKTPTGSVSQQQPSGLPPATQTRSDVLQPLSKIGSPKGFDLSGTLVSKALMSSTEATISKSLLDLVMFGQVYQLCLINHSNMGSHSSLLHKVMT